MSRKTLFSTVMSEALIRFSRQFSAALLAVLVLMSGGVQAQKAESKATNAEPLRPVLVQGAMPIEVEVLIKKLENSSVEKIGGWTFWKGTVDGYPVVVSKTLKGMSNTAAATAMPKR